MVLNNLGIKRASSAVHFDASIVLDFMQKVRDPGFWQLSGLVIFIRLVTSLSQAIAIDEA
jgi:hypothetical protein